ncbi:MAG: cytidylyltransferase family protein [archaeon GB-1867-005]|nr:cytidylyltransferase family protein [Candidatus Culexmicrobium cathedralense]
MEQKAVTEKVNKYINSLAYVLNQIKKENIEEDNVKNVVDLAGKYLADAKYYFKAGDIFTSLVCVVYAEGLLDSLRFLGKLEYHWQFEVPKAEEKKVVIAGTFDLIHPGHLWFIRKASEYGKLTVIVARDESVKRFKGHLPIIPENQRLMVVKGLKHVDDAVLGYPGEDILRIMEKLKPDVIILGPDQHFVSEKDLEEKLRSRGLSTKVIRIGEQYTDCKFFKTSDIIREIKRRANLNRI